jgi:hypothetical protein
MKWLTVVTAPDKMTAEMWAELLHNEGIPALVQEIGLSVYLGPIATRCNLKVPEERIEEARALFESIDTEFEIIEPDGDEPPHGAASS